MGENSNVNMEEEEELLKKSYLEPSSKTAFGGAPPLIQALRGKIPPNKIYDWLKTQDTFTLHRPVRHNFPRLHYNVSNIDDVFEGDLADMQSLKSYNDGYTFLLVVIDVVSKYVWVEPVKNKTNKVITAVFSKILKSSGRKPVTFQCDSGGEFTGREFQKFLKEQNIRFRKTRDPNVKAAIVERFIRTLKSKIWRYFTFANTKRYIDILQDIVRGYNNSIHSSIKMTPASVTLKNAHIAVKNIRNKYKPVVRTPKYTVGEYVRVIRERGVFEKGYVAGYTEEIFKIIKVLTHRKPPVYVLEDFNGDAVNGVFYEEELSPVIIKPTTLYQIDQIIKTAGVGRNKKYFVSWAGYPASFNSWIAASEVEDITAK